MKKIITFLALSINCCDSAAQNISAQEKTFLVTKIKELVTDNFVNTDKAILVNDSLNAAAFSEVYDITEFVRLLNKKLYYYTNDQHLTVEYNPAYSKELSNKEDKKVEQAAKEKRENYGFSDVRILPGKIGYLRLRYFADTGNAKQTALHSLATFKNTRSLIIDLTNNSGGSGSMVQLLCSFFLALPDHPLLRIAYRVGDTVTLKTYTGTDRPMYNKPVFILCDQRTFSAAEAFTVIMKNRGRAVVIGETTSGAGNIAGPYFLNNDYIITIPVGKIVDPLTGKGWEGSGVIPDIKADSSAALKIAGELAKRKIYKKHDGIFLKKHTLK